MTAGEGGASPDEVPLSPAQEAMYFLYRLAPRSPAYNTASPGRIRGPLQVPALRRAFLRMAARHPQLSLRFQLGPEGPRALRGGAPATFTVIDAAGWSAERLRQGVLEALRRPFELERGPLVRCDLFAVAPDDHLFVPASHHIVFDLWSAAICLEEIGRLYAEECGGEKVSLRPPGDYGEYVAALRKRLASEDGRELAAYWRGALAGLPVPRPLADQRPRPAVRGFQGGTVSATLAPEDLSRLRSLGESEAASPLMVLTAAFQLLLSVEAGEEDVVATTVVHGRDRPRYRDVLGLFINTLALRTRPARSLTFRRYLAQVRDVTYGAFRNAAYPFHLALEPLPEASRQAATRYQLVYQGSGRIDLAGFPAMYSGVPGASLRVGGLTLESVDATAEEGQFDLHLLVYDADGGYAVQLKYDAELFSASTARRLCQRFLDLLRQAAEAPDRTLEALAADTAKVGGLSDDDVEALLLELAQNPDRSGA